MKTTPQHANYNLMLKNDRPVLCIGSQGTGKTYGAIKEALERLRQKGGINRIIVTRPNVPFADSLGLLPGTDQEKLAPWVRPVRDILGQLVPSAQLETFEKAGVIEYLPFEHIQGLTFDNAFIILDEVQNATYGQLQIFLGRQGQFSKVVLCGDIKQTSEKFKGSGLSELIKMLRYTGVGCDIVEFTLDDCVRSEECKGWLLGFEAWDDHKEQKSSRKSRPVITKLA